MPTRVGPRCCYGVLIQFRIDCPARGSPLLMMTAPMASADARSSLPTMTMQPMTSPGERADRGGDVAAAIPAVGDVPDHLLVGPVLLGGCRWTPAAMAARASGERTGVNVAWVRSAETCARIGTAAPSNGSTSPIRSMVCPRASTTRSSCSLRDERRVAQLGNDGGSVGGGARVKTRQARGRRWRCRRRWSVPRWPGPPAMARRRMRFIGSGFRFRRVGGVPGPTIGTSAVARRMCVMSAPAL